MLRDTWHANAGCLARKFALPAADELRELILDQQMRTFTPVQDMDLEADTTVPQLRVRQKKAPRAPRLSAEIHT